MNLSINSQSTKSSNNQNSLPENIHSRPESRSLQQFPMDLEEEKHLAKKLLFGALSMTEDLSFQWKKQTKLNQFQILCDKFRPEAYNYISVVTDFIQREKTISRIIQLKVMISCIYQYGETLTKKDLDSQTVSQVFQMWKDSWKKVQQYVISKREMIKIKGALQEANERMGHNSPGMQRTQSHSKITTWNKH